MQQHSIAVGEIEMNAEPSGRSAADKHPAGDATLSGKFRRASAEVELGQLPRSLNQPRKEIQNLPNDVHDLTVLVRQRIAAGGR